MADTELNSDINRNEEIDSYTETVLTSGVDDLSFFEEGPRENPFEKQGFTEDEYNIAVKVMSSFVKNPKDIQHKAFKQLRVSGAKVFMEGVRPTLFDGQDESKYRKKRRNKLESNRRQILLKEQDKRYINQRTMRLERLAQFNKLLEDGKPHVDETLLLTNKTSKFEIEDVVEDDEFKEKDVLHNARSCYICKNRFFQLHFFYDLLCPQCAELSWQKRNQEADLTGRIAIVTGARIKIGYHCALKLLRCGAVVIATTRFPHDAALRFAKEPDFEKFSTRLHIYGLDMRNLSSVEEFVTIIQSKFSHLDILINNACQTVRKPPAFYSHLMAIELQPSNNLPIEVQDILSLNKLISSVRSPALPLIENASVSGDTDVTVTTNPIISNIQDAIKINPSAALSQVPLLEEDSIHDENSFPIGKLDHHNQQIDLRVTNTWLTPLEQVPTIELVEVTTINSLSPFILCSKFKNMMIQSPQKTKYIVNVSAMEGKFYRYKTPHHPHTNMAKASLNMLTRTSSEDYAKSDIYMTAVDTGWVTEENPFLKAVNYAISADFICPLDEIEAMARILDPIFVGINSGVNIHGKFLKDYHETEW